RLRAFVLSRFRALFGAFRIAGRPSGGEETAVRIGIIGARRGSAFAAAFQEMADVAVAALCDLDPQALAAMADRFRIPQRFADYEQMVATDLEAVVVASPMPLHVPHAAAALAAGKHVLSEVPAA